MQECAMPALDTLLAFLAASALITLAPGPDNLMVLSLGASRGRAAGIGFGLGCAAGCASHTLWAALGVGALVLASDVAFTALKLAGAAYLAWIGWMSWRHAGAATATRMDAGASPEFGRQFRRGLVANAINPKVALFFIAFLPQFVVVNRGPVWLQIVVLGVLFAGQTIFIFGAIGWFAGRIGTALQRRPGIGVWLDRVAGTLFLALAMKLALATR